MRDAGDYRPGEGPHVSDDRSEHLSTVGSTQATEVEQQSNDNAWQLREGNNVYSGAWVVAT